MTRGSTPTDWKRLGYQITLMVIPMLLAQVLKIPLDDQFVIGEPHDDHLTKTAP